MTSKPARRGGIELLRIISMVFIVLHHFAVHTNWVFPEKVTFNEYFLNFAMSFGKVGVGIFFMITGYFLYSQKSFKWQRIFKVLRPMWFYALAGLAFGFVMKMKAAEFSFPVNELVAKSFFPLTTTAYWFVSAYVVIILMSPILKKWFDVLSGREILGLLVLMTAATWGTRFLGFVAGQRWEVALNLGGAGFYYVLAGYAVRRFEDRIKRWWAVVATAGGVLMFALAPIVKFGLIKMGYTGVPRDLVWSSMSVPCTLTAVGIFVLVKDLPIKSRVVNYIAGLTFGVYLLHDNCFMREWLWKGAGVLDVAGSFSMHGPKFILYTVAVCAAVFVGSCIVEAGRQLTVSMVKLVYGKIPRRSAGPDSAKRID